MVRIRARWFRRQARQSINGSKKRSDDLSEQPGRDPSPVDYNSLCQWRSQNVSVNHNTFSFNPSDGVFAGSNCTQANNCGQSGLFSIYSSTSAYPAYTGRERRHQQSVWQLVLRQHLHRAVDVLLLQSGRRNATPAQWQAGVSNVEGSGDNFGPQDVHSTFS